MDNQHETNKQLKQELIELQQKYNSLKELSDAQNSMGKYAYDEMLETNLKLTLAMQGGNMAWWEMDIPTGNVTFDKYKVEMLGYPPENFKHYKDFTALVHPKDCKRIMNAMRGHLEGTLDKYEAEYRILASSGEYIWFYDYGSVVKNDPDGKPLIVSGFVYNITDKKKAEERYSLISKAVASTTEAIAIADSKGRHFYQNKALSDLFGYETAEETEAAGGGMARVKDPAVAIQIFDTILNGESWSGELEMVTKSGRVFPAYERADAIKDNEGNTIGVIGIISDITERRQSEEILLKSENMLQTVLDNFPGLVFWKNRQSRFLGCNQPCATAAGLKSPAEIVGKTDHEMPWSSEANDYVKDDITVMESGKGRMHIVEMLPQSDGPAIWLDTCKLPLRDSSGQVVGVIGVSSDISMLKAAEQELIAKNKELAFEIVEKEKRAAELIIANKELLYQNEEKENRAVELIIAKDHAEQSDRLKSAFLANMSHEIRTPMNGVLGFASLLKESDISGEERGVYLELIEKSGARMLKIINDIVDISKIESGLIEVQLEKSNINEQIDFIHAFFKPEVDRKRIQLSCVKPLLAKDAFINTDQEKIYAILINLVKNAIQYTDEGSIEFGYNLKTENQDNELEFFVKDTGFGIPKDRQEAIFERFMQSDITNKLARQGAGLGLSIAKAFVELLGGKIRVSSEEGKGSTFYFTIPYKSQPPVKNDKLAKIVIH